MAAAGGQLVVAPNTDVEVIFEAQRLGLVCLPGVATPTEAFAALAAGAQGLKLFPAEMASPVVLKALRAVLPAGTAVLPVGGITPDSLAAWRAAGAAGAGIGLLWGLGVAANLIPAIGPVIAGGFLGLLVAGHGVMIGECDDMNTGRHRPLYEPPRAISAIRVC